jgi:two-component system, OmpR family, response regulator
VLVRVLIIEDEEDQRLAIHRWLRSAGFAVDAVGDVSDADFELAVNAYDCVVFDRMLPKSDLLPTGDSLDYVRSRRAQGWQVPVLFLTALHSVTDVVDGLGVGDDYLAKPFGMEEMEARVRRLCTRSVPGPPPVLRCGDLQLDPGRHEVHRAGALLTLSRTEFGVLELLLIRQPDPATTKELIMRFWDPVKPDHNALQQCIVNLRKKMHAPRMIHNVRGVGYRIAPA